VGEKRITTQKKWVKQTDKEKGKIKSLPEEGLKEDRKKEGNSHSLNEGISRYLFHKKGGYGPSKKILRIGGEKILTETQGKEKRKKAGNSPKTPIKGSPIKIKLGEILGGGKKGK